MFYKLFVGFIMRFRLLMLSFILFPLLSYGLIFTLPKNGDTVVGSVKKIVLNRRANINKLARKYEVGYFEFQEANPRINIKHLRIGMHLVIPSQFILPNTIHKGIVINRSELRLFFYMPKKHLLMTFPIGIGRREDPTPILNTTIIEKKQHPFWRPTVAARKKFLFNTGMELPELIDPGPDNPLGNYAMRLGRWTYLIHGTNQPNGVGIRSSAGCIRMYPESISALFPLVRIGTPVNIVDQPLEIGWKNRKLYLVSLVPMDKKGNFSYHRRNKIEALKTLLRPIIRSQRVEINWSKAIKVANQETGIPTIIGTKF